MDIALGVTPNPKDNTQSRSAQEILTSMQRWPYWDEIRLAVSKDYFVVNEDFDRALPEYQKFLCLAAMGYEGLGMYSNRVAMLWCAHILSTTLYADFCASVVGRFVHHSPNTVTIKNEDEPCKICQVCSIRCNVCHRDGRYGKGSKETFVAAYQAIFGPISPLWEELSEPDAMTC